jgi:hypothetical protein
MNETTLIGIIRNVKLTSERNTKDHRYRWAHGLTKSTKKKNSGLRFSVQTKFYFGIYFKAKIQMPQVKGNQMS